MNEPIYEIHGRERRRLKKQLAEIDRYVAMFYHVEDLCAVYGHARDPHLSETVLAAAKQHAELLRERLSIPYRPSLPPRQ
jgi:hypothetical protein